jgi:bla regulator protein BlaR1
VDGGNQEQLYHILLHELVHLKQGDIWFSWFWTFLSLLQWFNPLLWWAGRSMYLDREMACDERVLELLGPERRVEYGRSLVELFKKLSLPARRPGLAGVVEQKTNIERRLTMIKRYRTGTTCRLIVGTLTVTALLAVSLTGFAASKQTSILSRDKAELMGRVEHFFLHNFRDITARKSVEWGEATIGKKTVAPSDICMRL